MAVYALWLSILCISIGFACFDDNMHQGLDLKGKFPFVLPDPSAAVWNNQYFGIPEQNIKTSCRAFIEKFADVAAEFTRCTILYSRPLRFCENCMNEYVTAKSVYKTIMEGMTISDTNERCGDAILNSDRIHLIVQTANFLDKVWSDSDCSNCFAEHDVNTNPQNYTISDDTAKFQELTNKTWQCFVHYSNKKIVPLHLGNNDTGNSSDVCSKCSKVYQDTNKFYVKLEEKYTHHVCMDIVDAMNFTRSLWSKTFECNERKGDIVGVLILSGLFCSCPVLFYISTKIYGTRMEHKILEEKRLKKNQASTSQAVS